MATKKKRPETKRQSVSSGRPRSYGDMYKNETTRPQISPVPAATHVTATAATESANWHAEYDYVVRDLRLLLIVSAVLFAVIIAAGFFI
jgi:hypothetical protein